MYFLKERIGKLLNDLSSLVYRHETPIEAYKMFRGNERFLELDRLDTSGWETLDGKCVWGGHREYFWFETTVTIPDSMDGAHVIYRLITGREGGWDATNPQFSLFVNGRLVQGMDVNHTEAVLTDHAKQGEQYRIVLSAFTGNQNFVLTLDSKLLALDSAVEQYYYDLKAPYETALLLPEDSPEYIGLITRLNESLNLLDMRREYSPEFYASLEKAAAYLRRELYDTWCGERAEKIYCVGHTHIDVAWLWTLAVTRDKVVRSFSTVLELMRRYPEYIFMSSQPQLYQFVKRDAPELYAEIKQRIAEGRWEADGGMWVEADCNLASGESIVRQFLYGKQFFQKEFGVDNHILWLPDVFGYSAALPQIMEKCGIRYFMTTKISWSEFNKIPYDTFMWEGIDGTRILTHFSPSREYVGAGVASEDNESFKHTNFTTYNALLKPLQVKGAWQRYQQKNLNNEALMSFGHGDGGGGPTREMLETQRRLAKGIPGCPQTVMSTAGRFFRELEDKVSGSKRLPIWVGELYLEYHRGTYTSMARNKKYNRRAEFTYQNAELFGMMSSLLAGTQYPKQAIDSGWETILLNQFHDILPGSSIGGVYEESKEQYEAILKEGGALINAGLQSVTDKIDAPRHTVVVFNPNGYCEGELVGFKCPQDIKIPAVYDGEKALPTQRDGDSILFVASGLPSKGYKSFTLAEAGTANAFDTCETMSVTVKHMENRFFSIDLAPNGQFSGIFDKRAGRGLLKDGQNGNILMSYEDRPHNFDAWDINDYYTEKSWEITEADAIEVTENGPVRAAIKVTRTYLQSTISQTIYIYRDIARIDIHSDIDWKEKQILVKAIFPVDVHSAEATFEIQYGNLKRNTHSNTSWDYAKFEVCAHKWLDISEDGYGVSILNDCKYGFGVRDGVIGISLIKSAVYPYPDADKERHRFVYSIYPHQGDWKAAGTVSQAYRLNNPPIAVLKQRDGGILPEYYSMLSVDCGNVVIEAVKRAEDGGDTVVRLYECHNRRTDVVMSFANKIEAVWECNLLEQEARPVPCGLDTAAFTMKPYEIKTFRVRFQPQNAQQN